MKTFFQQMTLKFASLDSRYIRLAFILIALTLSVIGAAAPEMGGELGG